MKEKVRTVQSDGSVKFSGWTWIPCERDKQKMLAMAGKKVYITTPTAVYSGSPKWNIQLAWRMEILTLDFESVGMVEYVIERKKL